MTGAGGWNEMLELAAAVCDGTATDADRVRLETLLATSPDLWPSYLRYMHVHASLGDRFRRPFPDPRPEPVGRTGLLTRRRMLGLAGAAAGVAAGAVALTRRWDEAATAPVRTAVLQVVGRVWVGTELVKHAATLLPGDMVRVEGHDSTATIGYSDGTSVTLTNESVVTVGDAGRRLTLLQGTATAGVPAQSVGIDPFVLATAEVTLTRLSGVVMTVGRALVGRSTEVGVHQGRVTVSSPTGAALGDVKGGEMMTVRGDGRPTTQQIPTTPDSFAWDLSRPLPKGWHVGHREVTADGPVVRPEYWFDPFHQAEMYQIRSDHQWAWGFFKLRPDSIFRVRYWVDKPGPSQLCICARQDRLPDSDTAMLECNGAFVDARPREWQWLEVKAGDMFFPEDAVRFPPPWVGFMVIFNTYKVDLGLKIAEFQVVPPGGPVNRD